MLTIYEYTLDPMESVVKKPGNTRSFLPFITAILRHTCVRHSDGL
jgi:hypothetical protein